MSSEINFPKYSYEMCSEKNFPKPWKMFQKKLFEMSFFSTFFSLLFPVKHFPLFFLYSCGVMAVVVEALVVVVYSTMVKSD